MPSAVVPESASKTVPKQLKPHLFQPGHSGNPSCRPKKYKTDALKKQLTGILDQSREKQVKTLRDQAAIVAHAYGKELADAISGSNKTLTPIEQERKAKVFGIAFDKVAGDQDQGLRLKLPSKLLNALFEAALITKGNPDRMKKDGGIIPTVRDESVEESTPLDASV